MRTVTASIDTLCWVAPQQPRVSMQMQCRAMAVAHRSPTASWSGTLEPACSAAALLLAVAPAAAPAPELPVLRGSAAAAASASRTKY